MKIKLLFIFLLTMTIVACDKENEIISSPDSFQNNNKSIQPVIFEGIEYFYYSDTILTNFNNFIVDTTIDNFIHIVAESDENQEIFKIRVYEFSDEDSFIKFGEELNIDVEGLINFENAVHDYISLNNTEIITELNQKIPEEYESFELALYNSVFSQKSTTVSGTTLHKNYWGGSPAHNMAFSMPVMWGWDNTVSATYPKYVYGAHTLYNKKWYRKRLATLSGWGWTYFRFVGPLSWLNDKMSSGITT